MREGERDSGYFNEAPLSISTLTYLPQISFSYLAEGPCERDSSRTSNRQQPPSVHHPTAW